MKDNAQNRSIIPGSQSIDLRVFEAMPGNSILVATDAPQFKILAVTDGMVERSGLSRSDLVGKPFFVPFPANPSNPLDPNGDGQNIVLQSFQHVLEHNEIHQLPVIRYDLANEANEFSEMYWRVYNKPVADSAGKVLFILHTSEDITAAIKTEQHALALKDIEEQHRLFMQAPIAIHILKGPGLVVDFANEPSLILWGKDREVIGQPLQKILPELQDQGFIDRLNEVQKTGEEFEAYELPVKILAGSETRNRLLNVVCQPYYDVQAEPAAGVIAFVTDVTDKIETRRALKESRERFEGAIAAIQGVLWTNNPEGKMTGEQNSWESLTGQTYEEYQNYGWTNALHPGDVEGTIAAWNEAVKNRTTFIYQHRVKMRTGNWGMFSVRAIPLFGEDGSIREWVGVHTDITVQEKIEQDLRESERRFRQLADHSPIFVFIIQPDAFATVSYWNKTWLNYTGQSHVQALGRAWNGIIHPDDIPAVMTHYTAAFENQSSYFIPAIRVKRHDGLYRWHVFKGNPRYLPSGEFNGFIGVGIDIHDQKLAEEAIKQSEERTRLAVEAAHLGTYEINVNEQTLIYSPRAAEIFGFDVNQLLSYEAFIDSLHPEDLPIRNKAHQQAKESGELQYEARILLPDNSTRFIRLNGKYFYRDSNPVLIGTVIDITDEKRAAELLEEKISERTRELKQVNEQLKQFTYSASHDLQEPLRKISILLDRLFSTLGPALTDESKNVAKRIQQTTGRMRVLIDDLLAYSNTTIAVSRFEETDLFELVKDLVDDMELTISEKGGKVSLAPLPQLLCDRRQVRQLFQNLIDNALKYSKTDIPPLVGINASIVKADELSEKITSARTGASYVAITVKDNGIGFEPEDADRIFNIFFRLHGREAYSGTGVGLAIVQKVVDNHRGYIIAEGVPGEGATFKVYFPMDK